MVRMTFLAAGTSFVLAVSSFAQTFTAKVDRVSDGDTFTVYDRTEQMRIRLEGVVCSEEKATLRRAQD
ncbi:MAG TPA: hypothetical protein VLK65_21425 [Vicinamibacteria bacterium]|nr:hypothetical protein [Vicinamibacteria bacterium]